jgi:hypothetical protein
MKTITSTFTVLLFLAFSSFARAGTETKAGPKSTPEFDTIKSLAGAWTTTAEMEGKKETVKTTYKVTSGGSAVEETLFAGTPHEMVSVYFLDQGKVMMTHYCTMANQPRMRMSDASKPKKIEFKMVDATGMQTPQDAVMGAMTLSVKDKDHMTEEWSMSAPDGKKEPHVFNYVREK